MMDTGNTVNNMEEENIIYQMVRFDSVYGKMENVLNGLKTRLFKGLKLKSKPLIHLTEFLLFFSNFSFRIIVFIVFRLIFSFNFCKRILIAFFVLKFIDFFQSKFSASFQILLIHLISTNRQNQSFHFIYSKQRILFFFIVLLN